MDWRSRSTPTRCAFRIEGGLTLSDRDSRRNLDGGSAAEFRGSFIDLVGSEQPDPQKLVKKVDELATTAAAAEGKARDLARLNLAQYYVGNQLAYEAIGVLKVLETDLKRKTAQEGQADTGDCRYHRRAAKGCLAILSTPGFNDEVDALMWRAIARTDAYDFWAHGPMRCISRMHSTPIHSGCAAVPVFRHPSGPRNHRSADGPALHGQ